MLVLAMTKHESEGTGSASFQRRKERHLTTGWDLLAVLKGTDM